MRSRRALIAGLVMGAVLIALLGFNVLQVGRGWQRLGPVRSGNPAPDLSLPSLAGPTFRLSSQRGKLVLLDFWAAWCAPCVRAMPALAAIQRELGGQGLRIISVNIEGSPERSREAERKLGPDIPILLDDGQVSQAYGVHVLPYLVVIGRDGRIREIMSGPVGEQRLRERLRAALAASR